MGASAWRMYMASIKRPNNRTSGPRRDPAQSTENPQRVGRGAASGSRDSRENPDNQKDAAAPVTGAEYRRKMRHRLRGFGIVFIILFALLVVYFVHYAISNQVKLFDNDYNHRDELLEKRNSKGTIYSSDGQVLAETVLGTDSSGNVTQSRNYPYANEFAHIVGYSDMGGSGIEEYYKYDLLHSDISLLEKIQYDNSDTAQGRMYPGNCLVTTLNTKVQGAAYQAIRSVTGSSGNAKGAVVATDPKTGAILAMVSEPDFDPNSVSANWDSLISDKTNGTLVNRATNGLYPPGSTFKIIDSIELLSEDPDALDTYSFNCPGYFTKDGETINCDDNVAHGEEDLTKSFAVSCNSSFSNIGINDITKSRFRSLLDDLYFNTALPYDLGAAQSKIAVSNDISTKEMMQVAIGQGTTEISPLHMNMITCAVANGGIMMKPHVAASLQDADGSTLKTYHTESLGQVIDSDVASKVQQLMRAVVSESDGTAHSAFTTTSYTVSGKTGSAEYDSEGNSHAWFTCYAPADDPQICVTVVVEGGGFGASTAVPIAKQVLDAYFAQ